MGKFYATLTGFFHSVSNYRVFGIDVFRLFHQETPFSQRRRTAPPAYYLSAKPERGTDAIGHNVLAVLPVNEVQQVNLPQRAIVNTQLVIGVFNGVSV